MQKTKKLLAAVLAIVMVLAGLPMYGTEVKAAETLAEGDLEYEVNEDGNSVMITKYTGSGENVTVPSRIDGKSVTSIKRWAFQDCSSLKKITIPAEVNEIGSFPGFINTYREKTASVFSRCSRLETIEVDASNEKYCSRDGVLFDKSRETLLKCPNKKSGTYTIPTGVKCIESDSFSGCSSLETIVISENVEEIHMWSGVPGVAGSVFSLCNSLTNIKVDENNTAYSSKDGILYDKTQQTIVACPIGRKGAYAIPEGVTTVGNSAFFACKNLTGVTIPNGVTVIGVYAFSGCSGLVSVTIPGSVTRILDSAFFGCSENFVMYGESGSAAETYAKENGLTFRLISDEDPSQDDISQETITCKKTLYKVTYGAKPFKINAVSQSKLTYTSSNAKIASVDKNTGKVTIKNTGVATITVNAGTKSVKITVKVSPKKQTVKSSKAVKGKKLTVGWAKDKTASGYQVQISTDKNFKKGLKSKNVSKTSYTFTKLKSGKKYYVRVRSYKKSGKEMLYGYWSKAKQSGKVKK